MSFESAQRLYDMQNDDRGYDGDMDELDEEMIQQAACEEPSEDEAFQAEKERWKT